MNHKILERKSAVRVTYIFMKYNFMIFPPTVCHRHTITLCMTWSGESVDVVVTCYNLDCRI
jgi:hypothetical protein